MVYSGTGKLFSWVQYNTWKFRTVRRVWMMLRLKAEASVAEVVLLLYIFLLSILLLGGIVIL
jgi:hypothetical protein